MVILASAKAKPWIGRDEETQCMLVFVLHRQHFTGTTALLVMRTGKYVLAVISLGNKLLSNKLCKCPKAFEVACVWFNLDLRSPGRWCEDFAKSKKNKWLALSQSNNNYETIHDMQQIKFYGFTLITAKNFHTQCNLVVWAIPEVEIHTYIHACNKVRFWCYNQNFNPLTSQWDTKHLAVIWIEISLISEIPLGLWRGSEYWYQPKWR